MSRNKHIVKWESKLEAFLINNVSAIKVPDSNERFQLTDVTLIVKLLRKLLDEEISETQLGRLKKDIVKYLEIVINFPNNDEMAIAIEGLAQKLESFIKKLAFIIYEGQNSLIYGDEICAGIINTNLHTLFQGKIDNHYEKRKKAVRNLPVEIVSFEGNNKNILEFVRKNIRNEVHKSNNYSRSKLVYYSELVIASYFIVIQSNISFLKGRYLPEYSYLNEILKTEKYKFFDRVYVEILGKEDIFSIDNIAVQLLDDYDVFVKHEEKQHEIIADENLDTQTEINQRVDTIINIANDTEKFVLIGDPGTGKTTTLFKIFYDYAKRFINNEVDVKIPVFIEANQYNYNHNFNDIIESQTEDWIKHYLLTGRVLFLFDGINEIEGKLRNRAKSELKGLVRKFHKCSFIITERKYGFNNVYNIPSFEIKELSYEQIRTLTINYTGNKSGEILNHIDSNPHLLQLAHVPLLLKMILVVCTKGSFPKNKGVLYDMFLNEILKREEIKVIKKGSISIKIDLLADLAFQMRNSQQVLIPFEKVKEVFKTKIKDLQSNTPVIDVIDELIDSNIISKNPHGDILFFHESYLEFYAAVELKKLFEIHETLPITLVDQVWIEPLILLSDLLNNKDLISKLISYLIQGKEKRLIKNLDHISFDDFSDMLDIAAIVSNNIAERFPSSFKYVENIILNHFRYWNKLYCKNTPKADLYLIILFKASALLGSASILNYIFHSDVIIQHWLYKESECFYHYSEYTEQFKQLTFSITVKNNNFKETYKAIYKALEYYSFFPSIVRRLWYIKSQLLNSTDFKVLKENYIHFKDEHIYLNIGKEDFLFLIENFDYNRFSISNICSHILKYHSNKNGAVEFVLSNIENDQIDLRQKRNFLETIMLHEYNINLLLEFFKVEITKNTNNELADICLELCQRIPCDKIPLEICDYYKREGIVQLKSDKLTGVRNNKPDHDRHAGSNNIDFTNTLKYHPDILSKNKLCIEYIKSKIHLPSALNFVLKLGLSHLFCDEIKDYLNIGIVLQDLKTGFQLKCFSLSDKRIIQIYDTFSQYNSFDQNNFVIIEPNNRLYKYDNLAYVKKFYCNSFIAEINEKRKEGFIFCKKSEQVYDSDYYFTFDDCDFIPRKMDFISFLPVVNITRTYEGYPKAIHITKSVSPICKVTNIINKNSYVFGFAENIKTKENLYFKIPNEGLEGYKGQLKVGQKYSYYKILDAVEDNLVEIMLLKKIKNRK